MPGETALLSIPGFKAQEEIYRSERTVVVRGIRQSDGAPVVIKTVSEDHHDVRAALRLSHEHEILQKFESPAIVRTLGLERASGAFALVLEDFGGTSLDRHLSSHRVDIPTFLAIASQLADALGLVHEAGIIHKDLNPSNILLNISSGKAKIADFGISSLLERDTQNDPSVRHLEGTLPYISPEQTGRMNRSIDYRTDFYSLGATLVYGALVQAPAHTFAGAISMGFCPEMPLDKPLCQGEGLQQKPYSTKKEKGFSLFPTRSLVDPWIVFQGEMDQVCTEAAIEAYVKEVPFGEIVPLPKVGHGFRVEGNWLPAFTKAFQRFDGSQTQTAGAN